MVTKRVDNFALARDLTRICGTRIEGFAVDENGDVVLRVNRPATASSGGDFQMTVTLTGCKAIKVKTS